MFTLFLAGDNVSTSQHRRLESQIKELGSKLEQEQTTRGRMESQIMQLKEAMEKINYECDSFSLQVNQYFLCICGLLIY